MAANSSTEVQPASSLPPDDPQRQITLARPETEQTLRQLSVAGDTYTTHLTRWLVPEVENPRLPHPRPLS